MRKVVIPTQAIVHEWLTYDPATGVFRWRKEPRPHAPLINRALGTVKNGYLFIQIPGFEQIGAHRLAWIYVHGVTVGGAEIDHKDGNPSNNAMDNLRLATSSQQKMNKRVQSNNQSGLKGAFYHSCRRGKKWRSQIKVGDTLIFLGYFHTAQEAHEAYASAAVHHFGEFARTS